MSFSIFPTSLILFSNIWLIFNFVFYRSFFIIIRWRNWGWNINILRVFIYIFIFYLLQIYFFLFSNLSFCYFLAFQLFFYFSDQIFFVDFLLDI